MNKALILLTLASFAFAGSATAKSLDLSQVADDANWVMHVDFDSARASPIGSFIMDKINDNPEAAKRMAAVKTSFGVDMEGFSSLTMFGNGEREKRHRHIEGRHRSRKIGRIRPVERKPRDHPKGESRDLFH